MSEESIERPFGIVAFDKGFVSEEQIIEAFELQVKESLKGKEHRLIGEILVSLGYMTDSQVDEVLQEIGN